MNDQCKTIRPGGVPIHEIKCFPPYYEAMLRGVKPFEVRRDDREYQAGHGLVIREWGPGDLEADPRKQQLAAYTGRSLTGRITYVFRGAGVQKNYCVLGVIVTGCAGE